MGVRPVMAEVRPSWGLAEAGDVQGLVVSGFGTLPVSCALFLHLGQAGGEWLPMLRKVAPITAADGPQPQAAIIAFTASGLRQIGLDKGLAGFQPPFVEGMMQADRRRRLGDDVTTILTGGDLTWSGDEQTRAGAAEATPPVHALLMLYEGDDTSLGKKVAAVKQVLVEGGVAVVREIGLSLRLRNGVGREHFGFADAISQPVPFGEGTTGAPGEENPRDPIHGVPLGEILLGYPNAHGETPPGPTVAGPERAGGGTAAARESGTRLMPLKDAAGLLDLGRNGTYLVVRELSQDVAAFWTSFDREAAKLNGTSTAAQAVTANWLAERVIGRTQAGDFLRPGGALPPLAGMPDNDALFFADDRLGHGCPLGSHVRRANPRDGLAAHPGDCPDLLKAANNHRILRRGRKFGAEIADPRVDDGAHRGLLFIGMNTDIVRQFEFVQQNWLLNPNFATLFQEVDPLLGPQGPMTLPGAPLRRKVDVETYVKLTGGEYFFMPGLAALDYIGAVAAKTRDAPPLPGGSP